MMALGLFMRVSLVSETYYPQVNGVSRTLGQLVRVLRAAGDTVQLIHPDYGNAVLGEHDCLVRSARFPFYRELHFPMPPFRSARRALDAFRPDLVHIATQATLGLSLLRHARRRGLPVVSSFHTNFDQYTDSYRVGWARGAIWRYLAWFHSQTLETYVPSRMSIGQLASLGFPRLVLWRRGVDSAHFRPDRPRRSAVREALGFAPEEVVIGHVSRIAAEKNVAFLAEALAEVTAARPQARILVVGDGPERPALERRLGPAARFAGYRTGSDLADHYAAADLFAFASRTETFGNVILEALASGLPVVAIHAGGPGETVREGITGRLVDPDLPPSCFARAVVDLIDDHATRRRLAEAARAFALEQSWDAVMNELRDRYLALVGEESAALGARGKAFDSAGF
jgi:glycosyltransferase involved in cell wall biosynthesis